MTNSQQSKIHNLCSELLSIENEIEFCKEFHLPTKQLTKRKQQITLALKRNNKHETWTLTINLTIHTITCHLHNTNSKSHKQTNQQNLSLYNTINFHIRPPLRSLRYLQNISIIHILSILILTTILI